MQTVYTAVNQTPWYSTSWYGFFERRPTVCLFVLLAFIKRSIKKVKNTLYVSFLHFKQFFAHAAPNLDIEKDNVAYLQKMRCAFRYSVDVSRQTVIESLTQGEESHWTYSCSSDN